MPKPSTDLKMREAKYLCFPKVEAKVQFCVSAGLSVWIDVMSIAGDSMTDTAAQAASAYVVSTRKPGTMY